MTAISLPCLSGGPGRRLDRQVPGPGTERLLSGRDIIPNSRLPSIPEYPFGAPAPA